MADPDIHLCMCCNMTIRGLDEYVHHKKFECFVLKKPPEHNLASQPDDIGMTTVQHMPYKAPESLLNGHDLDTSVHLNDFSLCSEYPDESGLTAADLENFFRCLELKSSKSVAGHTEMQSKLDNILSASNVKQEFDVLNHAEGDQAGKIEDTSEWKSASIVDEFLKHRFDDGGLCDEERSKAMQLTCVLTDLNFDSEGSDEFNESDAEDLLNYSEVEAQRNPLGDLSLMDPHEITTRCAQINTGVNTDKNQDVSIVAEHVSSAGNTAVINKTNLSKKVLEKLLPGKWRPGETPELVRRQHHSRGKWQSPEGDDVGDDSDDASEGKCRNDEVCENNSRLSLELDMTVEDEVVEEDQNDCVSSASILIIESSVKLIQEVAQVPSAPIDQVIFTSKEERNGGNGFCKICNKDYKWKCNLERHQRSALHLKRSKAMLKDSSKMDVENKDSDDKVIRNEDSNDRVKENKDSSDRVKENKDSDEKVKENIHSCDRVTENKGQSEAYCMENMSFKCKLCNKNFFSKYSLARHIMTPFHMRRVRYNDKHFQDTQQMPVGESLHLLILRLRPFQCRICNFFVNTSDQLSLHLLTEKHCQNVGKLVGPFLCTRCMFACSKNEEMVEHVGSVEHKRITSSSVRPCVLKEQRSRVKCSHCEKLFHSAEQLLLHISARHSERHTDPISSGNGLLVNSIKCATGTTSQHMPSNNNLKAQNQSGEQRAENSERIINKNLRGHAKAASVTEGSKSKFDNDVDDNDDGDDDDGASDIDDESNSKIESLFRTDKLTDTAGTIQNGKCFHISASKFNTRDDRNLMNFSKRKKSLRISKLYKCDVCKTTFRNIGTFQMHESIHQNECENERSEEIAKSNKSQKVKCIKRIGSKNKSQYACKKCRFKASCYSDLSKHKNEMHFKDKLYCNTCGMCFDRNRDLRLHFLTKGHLGRIEESQKPEAIIHYCTQCKRRFYSELSLRTHQISHSTAVGTIPTSAESVPTSNSISIKKWAQKVACPICEKILTRGNLGQHIRKHTGVLKKLKDNERIGLENKSQYTCKECTFTATCYVDLRTHWREVHFTGKLYCNICGICCRRNREFREHFLTTGHLKKSQESQKPDAVISDCTQCKKRFYSKLSLETHKIIHSTAVNSISTSAESAPSSNSTSIKRSAETIACPICEKLIRRGNFRFHIKYHNSVLPFRCEHCNESLADLNTLERHVCRHVGIIPSFMCLHCSIIFAQQIDLDEHIVMMHRDLKGQKCTNDADHTPSPSNNNFKSLNRSGLLKAESSGERNSFQNVIGPSETLSVCEDSKSNFDDNDYGNDEAVCDTDDISTCKIEGLVDTEQVPDATGTLPIGKSFECATSKMLDDRKLANFSNQKKSLRISNLYKCDVCKKTFRNIGTFKLHESSHQNELENGSDAEEEAKNNKNRKAKSNQKIRLRNKSQYMCKKCSFTALCYSDFSKHKNEVHFKEKLCCKTCGICFDRNRDFRVHFLTKGHLKKIEESQKPDAIISDCTHCKRRFYSELSLRTHKIIHSAAVDSITASAESVPTSISTSIKKWAQKVACPICEKTLLRRNLGHHIRKHTSLLKKFKSNEKKGLENKSEYACQECSFTTACYGDLSRHRSEVHFNEDVYCSTCGFRSMYNQSLRLHFLTKGHLEKVSESLRPDAIISDCTHCKKRFYSELSLRMHKIIHDAPEGSANTIDNISATGESTPHSNSISHKQYSEKVACPICKKILVRENLHFHVRNHTGVLPFRCEYCSKSFANPAALRRHIRAHLGITRTFLCQHCSKTFEEQVKLDKHILKMHKDSTKALPTTFLCNICGAEFVRAFLLRIHEKWHNRTITCPVPGCGKKYMFDSQLKFHMQTLHSEKRSYLCDECGYAAKCKNQLSRHRRIHSDERRYRCKQCPYASKLSGNLRTHEMMHSNEKPYKCPYCRHACNNIENLRKHILTSRAHAGLPVYPCRLCDFGTNSFVESQKHQVEMHKENSVLNN